VTPENLHEFFLASAGVAGALIGLLFVAISVSQDRLSRDERSELHQLRAGAALTAFTNALTVSLLALVPGEKLAVTAVVVGVGGLMFELAALLALTRSRRLQPQLPREATFLVALAAVFTLQVVDGVLLLHTPGAATHARTIAVLVVVCFVIGIARAWELIGGPSIAMTGELRALVRESRARNRSDGD
jgi:hypothetical protein